MSRTDKTRPYWVKVEDPYNRRYVEESHDHRTSDCDFRGESAWYSRGSMPGWKASNYIAFWSVAAQRCVIKPKLSYAGFGELMARTCGSWCLFCDPEMGYEGRQRARWRSLAQQILKTRIEDLDRLEEVTTCARFIRRGRGAHW